MREWLKRNMRARRRLVEVFFGLLFIVGLNVYRNSILSLGWPRRALLWVVSLVTFGLVASVVLLFIRKTFHERRRRDQGNR